MRASRSRGELSRVSRPRLILGPRVALQVCAEGLAEEFDPGIGEFEIGMSRVGNAADIVFTKDGWFQHEIIWNHDCVGASELR